MITIKNYSEICGQHVGDEGHKIVGVDELPTQYSIICYDNKNPRFNHTEIRKNPTKKPTNQINF
jgi:hypothetical protein